MCDREKRKLVFNTLVLILLTTCVIMSTLIVGRIIANMGRFTINGIFAIIVNATIYVVCAKSWIQVIKHWRHKYQTSHVWQSILTPEEVSIGGGSIKRITFKKVLLALILYVGVMYVNITTIVDYSKTLPKDFFSWNRLQYCIFFVILAFSYFITQSLFKYMVMYSKKRHKPRRQKQ